MRGAAHQINGPTTPGQPPWLEQVRQEQIASLYRNVLLGTSAVWVAAGVLVLLLYQQRVAGAVTLGVWFGLITLLTLSRFALAAIYKRTGDKADWRKWGFWFSAGTVSSGLVWGIGSLFLMAPERFDLQLLIVVLLSAISYGALAAFGRWPPAFYGFFLPTMVPSALWSLLQSDIPHITFGVLAMIWIPAVAWLAWGYYKEAVQALSLGFENAALAADLRRQKEVADGASIAKSRFLAAASHDLRQPVHALGLFVAALKNEKLEAPAQRLVDQIDGAVDGLDSLFTALLDVSRLDAGVVQAQPQPMALRPVLDRIVRDLSPAADAKALALRLQCGDVWVRSDPVLLERVLRNLVGNAVTHTKSGGVLVGVRSASREKCSIEVWDTGPGIPEAQRELVFQEFYQLDNAERSREGGLGLGLAIVRRLSVLLGHEISLRSVEGRGSVFAIAAPFSERAAPQAPAAEIVAMPRARIWVIDDDGPARAGTQALLTAWGHDVRAAASSADLMAQPVDHASAPHLILSDYRLANEDGIAVIAALRAHIGAQTPAALITGDTDPERLREAAASGLPLLHKPVAKARLRALIGNLTRTGLQTA